MISLLNLDPATYQPHGLHSHERVYQETNCYTDVVIELLSARGDDPTAMLGHCIAVDFEGDQWTFFKPPPQDLRRLYGVDVHEAQVYLPVDQHIRTQLLQHRSVIVELDAWYLPDTAATSYRREHVKTSVVAEAIDLDGRAFRYFHNAGYHELTGDDYVGVFRASANPAAHGATHSAAGPEPGAPAAHALPPYLELVRFDAGPRLHGPELAAEARSILREHYQRVPFDNPFVRFGDSLHADLPSLLAGPIETYHAYAFANVRMPGATFELALTHLGWLFGAEADDVNAALQRIVDNSKALSFRLARRRPFDAAAASAALAEDWARAMNGLSKLL